MPLTFHDDDEPIQIDIMLTAAPTDEDTPRALRDILAGLRGQVTTVTDDALFNGFKSIYKVARKTAGLAGRSERAGRSASGVRGRGHLWAELLGGRHAVHHRRCGGDTVDHIQAADQGLTRVLTHPAKFAVLLYSLCGIFV